MKSVRALCVTGLGGLLLAPPIDAIADVVPVMPPRNGQADYKTPEQLLGTILTNMSSTCDDPVPTRDWIEFAKMSCGYRSVRHANEGMGWAELITNPNDTDSLLLWPTIMWPKPQCDNDTTNALAWWTRMYGGTVDQTLYMAQVGRIDVFGPHGAGWEAKWDSLNNIWLDKANS